MKPMDNSSARPDKTLERRREQNRQAQRRFRERQSSQINATVFDSVALSTLDVQSQAEISATELIAMEFLNTPESLGLYFDPAISSNSDARSHSTTRTNSGLHVSDRSAEQQQLTTFTEDAMKDRTTSGEFSLPDDLVSRSIRLRGETEEPGHKSSGWLSPLHIAAKRGHDKIVELLMQHNPNINHKDSDGATPLMLAVEGGFEEVVCSLLFHGASVAEMNAQMQSSLHLAVIHRHEGLLQKLLENCQDPESAVNSYDIDGQTPLHLAIDISFFEGVQLLLRYGANVSLMAQKTPL